MSRPLTPEQLAKREALKNRTTEEVYQDAVKRGLESNVAAERVAAIKAYADERNPGIMEMKDKLKQAEDARTAAETALKAVTAERNTAQAILVIAIQSALQGSAAKGELAALKTDFDARIADARKELVDDATQKLWAAQRSENAAKETLKTAQAEFGARGQQILLDEVKKIVEQYSVPEPDPASLPSGISPLYLTLFGHSAVRAQLMLGYSKAFPEPNEAFKNTLLRVLRARLPLYECTPQSDPIPDIDVKQDVLVSMARKWNVLDEVQRLIDSEQVTRQANFLRNHHAQMQSQSNDAALRGEGRTPIAVEEKSITGCPLSEHDALCVCKICSPNLRRLGSLDVIGGEENF